MAAKTKAKAKAKARPKDVGSGKPRYLKLGMVACYVAVVGDVDDDLDQDFAYLSCVETKNVRKAEWIIIAIDKPQHLKRIVEVRAKMDDDAKIWCVWPKGQKGPDAVTENDIRNTALAGDLVDVKVMSWSATHSGLKLVVRKALRAK